ncbi:Signal transduction response regulator / Disease resistance domain-containing protein [Brevibacterium yomogidense]|uniref:Signal transduction response regulator / Disease resistance domain-containing protein n=1 Tax=Brevibacterium yomogidense TaxID=946573 RepID=A0A1X6XDR1_9MICO|nr:Signal transduction response regulator / Disease resistance domain-containing protein [Brevibacterium yomogidense]
MMGRVEIFTDDTSWGVHGRTQRALLSLLILRLRVWTPAPYLVRALWPSDASDRALARLHVQIHRLRRQLGGDVVNSSPNGYRLNIRDDSIDAWRFERSAESALAHTGRGGHDAHLVRRLDEALAHWGGEPFPNVDAADVDTWRHTLHELHTRAQEVRSETLLHLGDSRAALDVLTPLAAQQPSNERVQALRMSALQQAGRSEMLPQVYEEARSALTDLDLTPGPDLLAAHAHLLDGHHTFAPPDGAPPAVPAPAPSLERAAALLRHREDELRRALAAHDDDRLSLLDGDGDHPPPAQDVSLRRELAYVLTGKGRHDEALSLLGHLEALHVMHGQEDDRAVVLRDMVAVMALTGDLRRALRLLGEAARMDERTTGTDALLQTVRALILTHMGRLTRAEDCLAAAGRSTSPRDRANGRDLMWWRARSQIDRRAGRHTESVPEALEASRIARAGSAGGDPGPSSLDVACSLRDAGDRTCFAWYRSVIRFAHDSGRFPLAACAHAAAAKAHLLWGDPETAAAHGRTALDLARRCGCWLFAGRAASRLAEAEEGLGNTRSAQFFRREALAAYRRADFPLAREVRARLEGRGVHARDHAGGTG